MEAARAYIEETAQQLDSGEKDLQVEGAIAKQFATEAGNACADDAIQAFGGYGYIAEYEVEKIKRDVKITAIYEGTSQVLQLVIGTFRWRTTIRSKGRYYEEIAKDMENIHAQLEDIGAGFAAGSARSLNTMISALHKAKLIRHQFILFELADIMIHVEVAAALMRKIHRLVTAGSKNSDKMKTIGRLFSAEVVERTHSKLNRIINGSGKLDDARRSQLASLISLDIAQSQKGSIGDMDHLVTYL